MIELYSFDTPNGRKISIMLEECGLPYRYHPIDIGSGAQFRSEFSRISPNNKIPAIIDPEGPEGQKLCLFESGAILIWLAEKTGRFLPVSGAARYAVMQWLMFQMGGIGPMFGQYHHFSRFAKQHVPYGKERYGKELRRLYGVLEKQLARSAYVAGETMSIADIAIFPWVARYEWHPTSWEEFPLIGKWYHALSARPGFRRGMGNLEERKPSGNAL